MNHLDYVRSIRRREGDHPNYRLEARTYKNAAGMTQLIYLPLTVWDYVEWLEVEDGVDFQDWVVHCELNPCKGFTLSHLLHYWLWLDECGRHRYGLTTPNGVKPEGYETSQYPANDT